MSGTIPLSMTQQFDQYGAPLSGGQLYFFQAGTVSTPQNAFVDGGLTIPHPNPITLDATGRVPQLFFADGLIKIRLTDRDGVVHLVADNVQVIGASSGGGGGGGTVDATAIYQTGDIKPRYGTGTHTGWVRANGKTIGSSVSGASELQANSAQPLFEYLWAADPTLPVLPSRGASANADWLANRQMTLPDIRGRAIIGLDDMGSLAAGRLPAAVVVNGTTVNGSTVVTGFVSTAALSVGMNVSGGGIPAGATVAGIGTTIPATGTLTNGSTTLSALSVNTNQLAVGMSVVGSGIPVGATIATIVDPTSITISAPPLTGNAASVTTLVALSFIDQNRITLSANATSSVTGPLTFTIVNGTVLGSTGGIALQKLSKSHLPNTVLPVAIGKDQGGHTHVQRANLGNAAGGGVAFGGLDTTLPLPVALLPAMSGTAALGEESGHNNVQPSMAVTIYMKL